MEGGRLQNAECIAAAGAASRLEALFREYATLEERIVADPAIADGLVSAQSLVMRTAAGAPARTPRDLLFKLALWRWDAPDLQTPIETLPRYNAVAVSAFRDLTAMVGEPSVSRPDDLD